MRFGEGDLLKPDVVDIMEAVIALCLLARISYEEKISLIFRICDTDNDDCLSVKEISNLCLLIEQVFSRECSLVVFQSTLLLQSLAEKKANMKFGRFLMSCYFNMEQKPSEDVLISYEEFIKILRANSTLYESFLPPTTNLKSALNPLMHL